MLFFGALSGAAIKVNLTREMQPQLTQPKTREPLPLHENTLPVCDLNCSLDRYAPLFNWQPDTNYIPYTPYVSEAVVVDELHQAIITTIKHKEWQSAIFDNSEADSQLSKLYRTNQIHDNPFSILKWRQAVARDYYAKTKPSDLPIHTVQERFDLVQAYFRHPDHRVRVDFIRRILPQDDSIQEFLSYLLDKLKTVDSKTNELYFCPYQLHANKLSQFVKRVLTTGGDLECHVFFPVPKNSHGTYEGIIPSLDLINFVYQCLHDFLVKKTNNAFFKVIKPKLMLTPLDAMELAEFHSKLEHPIAISTAENPLTKADGLQTFDYCFALHDFGFHLFRYFLQDYFQIASNMFYSIVIPFFEQNKSRYPKEYASFIAADDTHVGRVANFLIDLEPVEVFDSRFYRPTRYPIYTTLYRGFFDFLINGPQGKRIDHMKEGSFNAKLTIQLFKAILFETYKLIPSDEFIELSIQILEGGRWNSLNHLTQNRLPVLRIFCQLIMEHHHSAFANLLKQIMAQFIQQTHVKIEEDKNKGIETALTQYLVFYDAEVNSATSISQRFFTSIDEMTHRSLEYLPAFKL